MKRIIMVLLLSTLAVYVFSDENVPKNEYAETENIHINFINVNPIFFYDSLSLYNSPLNISSYNNKNNLFSNMEYEPIITIEDKKKAFGDIMFLTFITLWWIEDYRDFITGNNYKYFESQWNKTIEEEELIRRLMINHK
ncbi:hypothetical protein [Treponema sp. R6D11]